MPKEYQKRALDVPHSQWKNCITEEQKEAHRKYNREYRKLRVDAFRGSVVRRTREAKAEMIAAYGGACTCCGETEPEFLTIDHKTKEARKRDTHASGTLVGGFKLYRRLKKLGWPKDEYGLLCLNCNWAKGKFGICPHQKSLATIFNLPQVA